MEILTVKSEPEWQNKLEGLRENPGRSSYGSTQNQNQLRSVIRLRQAVIRPSLKSRMREICTYGSVVGPVQQWAGLPDLLVESPR